MRHLKLFEGFKSRKISRFVKSTRGGVLQKIKNLISDMGINIHHISDDDVHYVSALQAVNKFKTGGLSDSNKTGIRYLKFWFDQEDKMVHITKTTDEESDDGEWDRIEKSLKRLHNKEGKFKKYKWDYELTHQNIPKYCMGEFNEITGVQYGKLYMEQGKRREISIIHNNPDLDGNPVPKGYTKDLRYSWYIGVTGERTFRDEVRHLYFFDDDDVKNDMEANSVDPSRWNTDVKGETDFQDIFDSSHYALVLDINAIMDKNPDISKIKKDRVESRKGAYSLQDESDIKHQYWDRMIKGILTKYGVLGNDKIKNVESLLLDMLCGEISLSVLMRAETISFLGVLENIITESYNSKIEEGSDWKTWGDGYHRGGDVERYKYVDDYVRYTRGKGVDKGNIPLSDEQINDFVSQYRIIRTKTHKIKKNLHKIKNYNEYDDITQEWLDNIFRISGKINNIIKEREISSPSTLIPLIHKLKGITTMFVDKNVNPMYAESKRTIKSLPVLLPIAIYFDESVDKLKEFEENISHLLR